MCQSNLVKTSNLNPYRSALSRSRASPVCKSHGPSNANRYIDRWVCSDSRKRFYPSSPMSSGPGKGIALPPMFKIRSGPGNGFTLPARGVVSPGNGFLPFQHTACFTGEQLSRKWILPFPHVSSMRVDTGNGHVPSSSFGFFC